MAKAFLRKTRESRVRSGHPWVFASDIEKVGKPSRGVEKKVPFVKIDNFSSRLKFAIISIFFNMVSFSSFMHFPFL